MKKFALILTLFISSFYASHAQNFEGIIEIEMIYKDLPAEMQPYKSMLPSGMTTYIKGRSSRVEKPATMGMEMTIIMDDSKKKTYVLIDAGDKKMYMENDVEEDDADEDDIEINYLEGEKEIAGYMCKKGEIVSDDGVVIFWYTPEITSDVHQDFNNLKGYPLEYEIEQEGMTITVRAKKVEAKKLSDKLFKVPSGYEKVTEEDLGRIMGGF